MEVLYVSQQDDYSQSPKFFVMLELDAGKQDEVATSSVARELASWVSLSPLAWRHQIGTAAVRGR